MSGSEPPEVLDVAVIGGGPAGILAAHRLGGTDARVRVFEASDEVGGRTRSVRLAGEVVNTGAMFVYVGTDSAAVCAEVGIETVPVTPASFGVHYGGRTVIAREDAELLTGLQMPDDAKAQLAKVLRDVREEYEAFTGSAGLTPESQLLASMSYAEHVGPLHEAVDGIVRNTVTGGSTASPDDLSAQYALRYFASYLVRAAGHRCYIPLGMQEMSIQLSRRLAPGVLSLHSPVESVSLRSDGSGCSDGRYDVTVSTKSKHETYRARQVVLATPGPAVAELAPWLPNWKLDAIAGVPTNPTTTLSIVADSSGMAGWDDIFVIATVDPPFNLVMQPRASADIRPSEHGRTYFNCYLSADIEAALPGDDQAMTAEWLEHFYRVVPDAEGRVLDTLLSRWPRCFAYPRPDREALLDAVRAPVGGMHFAGDYTSATAGSHGAFGEAERVAADVTAALAAV